MLNHYLLLALRHIRRNGRYVLINVLGLGVAVAFAIQAFLNWQFGRNFDRWHADGERLFRVEVVRQSNGQLHGVCPAALSHFAAPALAQVEATTRIDSRGLIVKRGDLVFNEAVHFADTNFFQFFNFKLLKGRADLRDRGTVLITQAVAKKYFGDQEPVGQTLELYADASYRFPVTVAGVLEEQPKNSSLRFAILTRLENQYEQNKPVDYTGWRWMVDATFLKLRSPADAPAVEAALQAYVAPQNSARQDWVVGRYVLEPFLEMATTSRDLRWNNLADGPPAASVWGLFILGSLILLTACFNFANMTISISDRRVREMGVRRVLGGTRRALVVQLLAEAGIICLLGVAAGCIFAIPLLDWYNRLHKFTDLKLDLLNNSPLLIFLIATTILTTLLAGAYPAIYSASPKPASLFKGGASFRGSSLPARLLLGVQVMVALVAVVMGLAFSRNAEFNRTADLGYDRESLIAVPVDSLAIFDKLRDACRENPRILEAVGTTSHVGWAFRTLEVGIQGQKHESNVFDVGEEYLSTVGLSMAEGEGFEKDLPGEARGKILVNQMFVNELLGGKSPLGAMVSVDSQTYQVAGVLEPFVADRFFDNAAPALFRWSPPEKFRFLIVRTRPQDLNETQRWLGETWKTLVPYKPYAGVFQNEVLAESLQVSANIAKMGALIALVALLLTVSGLFALVSLNVLKRLKEIAIRRVLGADPGTVAWLLNRNYAWIFLGAAVLGCLGGRFFALALLNSIFKVHAGVGLPTLLGSAAVILAVAGATIAVKLVQTLRVNPATILKTDG